jgi:hypothetical protein
MKHVYTYPTVAPLPCDRLRRAAAEFDPDQRTSRFGRDQPDAVARRRMAPDVDEAAPRHGSLPDSWATST